MENAAEKKTRRCSEEANLARGGDPGDSHGPLRGARVLRRVTQALADRLGVGKGTIYRHFPSKRALFLAAADRVCARCRSR